jgi:hypothetical protein
MMSETGRPSLDAFELVHSFVTASLQGELTEGEIEDFETLLQGNAELQRVYANYLNATLQIPRMLAAMEGVDKSSESNSPPPPSDHTGSNDRTAAKRSSGPVLGFLGDASRTAWGFLGDHAMLFSLTALLLVGASALIWFKIHDTPRADVAQRKAEGDSLAQQRSGAADLLAANPAPPVARLLRTHDCQWAPGCPSLDPGDSLVAGQKLVLRSGLVEIVFARGAQVVMEGPASLTITSDNVAVLDAGKLTAMVPEPAIGFTVNTPWTRLIDLGTEFGMEVDSSGLGDVHVFRGEVAIDPPEPRPSKQDAAPAPVTNSDSTVTDLQALFSNAPAVFLRENESLRVERAHSGSEVIVRGEANPAKFIRVSQMPPVKGKVEADEQLPAICRWKAFRDELCKRNELVACYDFLPDKSDRSVLRNLAATGRALDGRIQSPAEWVSGRMPGKSALAFGNRGSGVHVNIPLEFQQMTLLAWVKVNRLSKVLNGLLMSDGESPPCLFQWQIRREGRMFAYCPDAGNAHARFVPLGSEPVFTSSCLSVWRLVAAVRDPRAGKQRFYLDGEPVGDEPIQADWPPVRIGAATIGGWDPREFHDKEGNHDRALEGRMDELMLFNMALSVEDIRRIYEAGKP